MIRASSTDSYTTKKSKSKSSNIRNKSLEGQEQFSPLKNYKKIMRKYYKQQRDKIQSINDKLSYLKNKFEMESKENKPKRSKIIVQIGHQVTPVQSENNQQVNHLQSYKNKKYQSESSQQNNNLKPMQKNKSTQKVIYIQQNHKKDQDNQSKSSQSNNDSNRMNLKNKKIGKYSQRKKKLKKQQSNDSLQYVNDYRQYANMIKNKKNNIQSKNRLNINFNMKQASPISILKNVSYERSKSDRLHKKSYDDSDQINDNFSIQIHNKQAFTDQNDMRDAKTSEKYRTQLGEKSKKSRKYSNHFSKQNNVSSLSKQKSLKQKKQLENQQKQNQIQQQKLKSDQKSENKQKQQRDQEFKKASSQFIQDSQNQPPEELISNAQTPKKQNSGNFGKIPKITHNPLRNPIIYQSHIESQNSQPTNSKLFIQSGKKKTFKQMLKMRQLNPRLVTSTILNQKNFHDGIPAKKNFKDIIKSNFTNIMIKQKQKTIKQMKESQQSKQFKGDEKQKKKKLLKAFFQQN